MNVTSSHEQLQKFIQNHIHDDVVRLALQRDKYPDVDFEYIINQIVTRNKAVKKLPHWSKNYRLVFPPELSLEQSSSEITALYKADICQGNTLADLTAGFGVDALHLASCFHTVTCCEPSSVLCEILLSNSKALNINNVIVFNDIAENFLNQNSIVFDWIYIDPSRRDIGGNRVPDLESYSPNIVDLMPKLLQYSHHLLIKLSPMLDLTLLLRKFQKIESIHIVAVENECKEVLLVLNSCRINNEIDIFTFTRNYTKNCIQKLDFMLEDEKYSSNIDIFSGDFSDFQYLYEPNVAVMKAGAFFTVAHRYDLCKLHYNSHLYLSKTFENNFPGRVFVIEHVYLSMTKSALNDLKTNGAHYNVAVRNFPISAERLKQQLKLKDGGDAYLFATTILQNQHVLIRCRRVL